ncbi:magnesium transporter [Hoyosella sp. YIM 151337]|uniref:magnesium transporter n=1 Tax=Hoyosella sp. YIM 151337 TaxID=2992742 RepID=UPI0022355E50|nr:magnesium transporter [Hoyosella sp. YIM 151337]MCW4354412.1 magnesium transporter [Hoyosella sp. YIM 151337]
MYTAMLFRIQNRNFERVKNDLAQLTPELVIDVLREMPPAERALAYRLLGKDTAIEVFEMVTDDEQVRLLEALAHPHAANVLSQLDVDDQVRLIDEAPAKIAKKLLATMPAEDRDRVATMLAYPPVSAGRMANPRYLAAHVTMTAAETLQRVRQTDLGPEDVTTVFIVDDALRYAGLVTVAELVRADPGARAGDLARLPAVAVMTTDDAAKAARMLQRRDLGALAVIDSERRMVGAITYDDAMDALEDDASETMYRKAGIGDPAHAKEVLRSEKLVTGSILYPVRVRILFLMITLAGGLMVGGLIEQFEDVLTAVVAVAIFVPLIMDMGGNVGTQSTTIFARALALGHITPETFKRQLAREMAVGATMAVIIGSLGGTIAYLWQGEPNGIPMLGLAVGLALFTSVSLATFLGFALPWLMVKLGLDHAPGADPFITTIKDFTGLAIYFGLATVLLGVA